MAQVWKPYRVHYDKYDSAPSDVHLRLVCTCENAATDVVYHQQTFQKEPVRPLKFFDTDARRRKKTPQTKSEGSEENLHTFPGHHQIAPLMNMAPLLEVCLPQPKIHPNHKPEKGKRMRTEQKRKRSKENGSVTNGLEDALWDLVILGTLIVTFQEEDVKFWDIYLRQLGIFEAPILLATRSKTMSYDPE